MPREPGPRAARRQSGRSTHSESKLHACSDLVCPRSPRHCVDSAAGAASSAMEEAAPAALHSQPSGEIEPPVSSSGSSSERCEEAVRRAVSLRLQEASLAAGRCYGNLQQTLAVKQYKLRLWADKFAPAPEDDQFLGFMEEPPNPWMPQEDAPEHVTAAEAQAGGLVASAGRATARHRGVPGETPGQWLARLRRSEQKEVADLLHRQAGEKRTAGDNDGARELYCWVRDLWPA